VLLNVKYCVHLIRFGIFLKAKPLPINKLHLCNEKSTCGIVKRQCSDKPAMLSLFCTYSKLMKPCLTNQVSTTNTGIPTIFGSTLPVPSVAYQPKNEHFFNEKSSSICRFSLVPLQCDEVYINTLTILTNLTVSTTTLDFSLYLIIYL